jgi:hypothetical protein
MKDKEARFRAPLRRVSVDRQRVGYRAFSPTAAPGLKPGIDEESIRAFDANLPGNLYKLWNRRCGGATRRRR